MRRRPWLRRALTVALIAATFVFLGREIFRGAAQLREFRWQVQPGLLLLSLVALVVVFLWGVAVWRVVIRKCGVEVALRPLARAWFLANLGRYVPGVVWQFVGLAQLGQGFGLAPSVIITTLLANMGFSLLAAVLVGAWLLPAELANGLAPLILALRWLSPLALVAVHPRVIRLALSVAGRLTKRPAVGWRGSWVDGALLLLQSAALWLLYGVAFHLFLASFAPLPLSAFPAVTATNALAFVVGYLVVIAPGGLGFKEGAIALLLAGLVPTAVAASLAIASRLWTITAEVLPALYLLREVPATAAQPQANEGSRPAERSD